MRRQRREAGGKLGSSGGYCNNPGRDDGGSGQNGNNGGEEMWVSSRYNLTTELTGFSDRLRMKREREESKMTNWKGGVATN